MAPTAWTRRSLLRASLATGLGCLGRGATGCAPTAEKIERRARKLEEQHGLRIGYGPPESFFVPPYTAADALPNRWTLRRAELRHVPAALDGIEEALERYPSGFVAARCKAIFLCGELLLDGVSVAGSYGPAWIVLRSGDEDFAGQNRLNTWSALHHELASFIWDPDPLLQSVWASHLPRGWTETGSVKEMVMVSSDRDERIADGFVTPYGATSASNDFSTYAEAAFIDPVRLARLPEKIPVVASKTALLIAAYTKLDGRMADVFDSLDLGHLADPHAWNIVSP